MFSGSFRAPFQNAFASAGVVAVPWYLSGGIALANCVAAYQAKGAASYAASKTNLSNPGAYDLSDGAEAPSWDGSGWTFNGTSQYLYEANSPAVNNTFSIVVYGTPNVAGTVASVISGSRASDGKGWGFKVNQYAFTQKLGFTLVGVADYSSNLVTPTVAAFMAVTINGTAVIHYLSGSNDNVTIGTMQTPFLNGITIGSQWVNGNPGDYYKGTIVAFAKYSIVLSGSQMSFLLTAMAAL